MLGKICSQLGMDQDGLVLFHLIQRDAQFRGLGDEFLCGNLPSAVVEETGNGGLLFIHPIAPGQFHRRFTDGQGMMEAFGRQFFFPAVPAFL